MWWWDGRQWIPATQAPIPPPHFGMPPPILLAPSPGLRAFLLVVLVIASVIWGLLTVFGILGESQNFSSGQWNDFHSGLVFFGIIAVLFLISLIATVGVFARTSWARWAAIPAGLAVCFAGLGLILRIPIPLAAAPPPRLPTNPPTPLHL